MDSLLEIQDLQDLHSKHNDLLSTEYLKSSNLRLNNHMYFKRLRKIDGKVRSYLDTAHYQALKIIKGQTQDVDTLSFIKPQQELKELLIHVSDVNVHYIFDSRVKKKFFRN